MANKDFDIIRKELKETEENREILIQLCRKTITLSKKIIYALHANKEPEHIQEIKDLVEQVKSNKVELGMKKVALQEYVEALTYYHYIKEHKLASKEELKVDVESYLLGLCDLTGELVRRAVNRAIEEDKDEVQKIKKFVADIYEEFLSFELRNSDLRHKADSLTWNLKKLEDVLFTMKTR